MVDLVYEMGVLDSVTYVGRMSAKGHHGGAD